MEEAGMKEKLAAWLKENIVAVIFSLLFIMVYIAKAFHPEVNDLLGVCSLKFMNGEYYRWFTCSFLHYGLYHLFGNIIGLLAVSSLISPLIGKWKMVFFFFASDVIGGIIFSWIVSSSSQIMAAAPPGAFLL